jgi:hypothetical protein
MRRLALVAAIVGLALVAGCIGAETDADVDSQSDTTGASDEARAPQTLYLHGEDELAAREPAGEPDRAPFGSFYTAWANGDEQPTWTSEALDQGLHVTEVELAFFYTAETAVATTGPQEQGFPEFVVYLGTAEAPMAWASVEGPDVVREGEVVELTAELNMPAGGIVLPAGSEPIVKLSPVQGQGSAEGTRIVFLANGTDTPARAELEAEPIALDGAGVETVVEQVGTLAGSAYALGADEQTTADSYEIEVPEATSGLAAQLERVDGAGIADIDLELLDGDGEVVARSVTPEAQEGLALREPNVDAIGEGPWTLRVVNYGNAAVEYALTAQRLAPTGS